MKINTLEVDSVQVRFEERTILSDVYLKCQTGEVLGLLGRNGSGKSTLLKVIFGIVSADFKFVKVNNMVKRTTKDLFADISYLSQEQFVPNAFSVQKAIRLSISKEKLTSFYEDEFILQMKHKRISELSGGELRYLELLLVLENDSKFVLLDEPYTGLSPLMIEKVNTLILKAAIQKGIVISDHNYHNVMKISTRLILLDKGKTHSVSGKNQLMELGYLSINMV